MSRTILKNSLKTSLSLIVCGAIWTIYFKVVGHIKFHPCMSPNPTVPYNNFIVLQVLHRMDTSTILDF